MKSIKKICVNCDNILTVNPDGVCDHCARKDFARHVKEALVVVGAFVMVTVILCSFATF